MESAPLARGISHGCWMESGASLSDLLLSSGSLLDIYGAWSPSAGNDFMEHLTSLFSGKLQLCVLMLERQV